MKGEGKWHEIIFFIKNETTSSVVIVDLYWKFSQQ